MEASQLPQVKWPVPFTVDSPVFPSQTFDSRCGQSLFKRQIRYTRGFRVTRCSAFAARPILLTDWLSYHLAQWHRPVEFLCSSIWRGHRQPPELNRPRRRHRRECRSGSYWTVQRILGWPPAIVQLHHQCPGACLKHRCWRRSVQVADWSGRKTVQGRRSIVKGRQGLR